jgi:biotin carboxylase
MPRVLLLLPSSSYRISDFLSAAKRLRVDVVVASDRANVLADRHPEGLLTLDFRDAPGAAIAVREFHALHPIDAVIPVDDDTAVIAAAIGELLSLPHNSVESAAAARNKLTFLELLRRREVPAPSFAAYSLADSPQRVSSQVRFPCVLKPLFLSASRGVIRADDEATFEAAWTRIVRILSEPEVASRGGEAAEKILVEDFVPGTEVALEGLLTEGNLEVLALFDKPDPLDGPFFDETIYVTPSRHPLSAQQSIAACAANAARAIGLRHGPIHAELRFNPEGIWIIEMAARSIGGLCSRALRFGTGLSLEDLILRHALNLDIAGMERESVAAGVMMIPIPRAGILREVQGLEDARRIPNIEEIIITAHSGKKLVPLPEGASYLGFIFSRAKAPEDVEKALRKACRRLEFVVD